MSANLPLGDKDTVALEVSRIYQRVIAASMSPDSDLHDHPVADVHLEAGRAVLDYLLSPPHKQVGPTRAASPVNLYRLQEALDENGDSEVLYDLAMEALRGEPEWFCVEHRALAPRGPRRWCSLMDLTAAVKKLAPNPDWHYPVCKIQRVVFVPVVDAASLGMAYRGRITRS